MIVYATDPGNVAADGDGRNGLFTSGLLTAFKGSNLSLDEVLTVASAEVERGSGQTQTPYVNGPKTIQKNFYFRPNVTTALPIQAFIPPVQPVYIPAPTNDNTVNERVSPPKRVLAKTITAPPVRNPSIAADHARCTTLLNKSALGEPISTSEKQELMQSCR